MLPTEPLTHGQVLRQVVSHLAAASIICTLPQPWWIPKQAVTGKASWRRESTEFGTGRWDNRNENVFFGTTVVIAKQNLRGLNSSRALQPGAALFLSKTALRYNH